jgi:hypothetical protein
MPKAQTKALAVPGSAWNRSREENESTAELNYFSPPNRLVLRHFL